MQVTRAADIDELWRLRGCWIGYLPPKNLGVIIWMVHIQTSCSTEISPEVRADNRGLPLFHSEVCTAQQYREKPPHVQS